MLQALARKYGIHYSRPGNGICHYVHIERFAKPGGILVGADSHTTTSGALGMIAIGAGGLDVAVAMGGYPYEIACPAVVEVHLDGTLARPWVQAKDIILELLRQLSASGGKNKVFEFTGPGTADLTRARARHDREHDRRAGRHLGGVPARRQHARVAEAPGARGRLRGDGARRRLRVRRARRDRPRRARPAGGQAAQPRQRRAGRGGGGHAGGAGLHRLVGQLRLRRPGAAGRDPGRQGRPARAPSAAPPRPRPARARSSWRSPSRASTASSWRAACGCSSRSAGRAWAWARRRRRTPTRCAPSTATSRAAPAPPEDSVYLCSPAVAAVSMLHGEIRDPREYGDPPELLEMPELKPYVDDVHIFAPADRGRGGRRSRSRAGPTSRRRPSTSRWRTRSRRRSPPSSRTTSRPATSRPTA